MHWFSVYQLGRHLRKHGCTQVLDRFDLVESGDQGRAGRLALALLRGFAPARFAGHVLTPYTLVVGRKAG